MNEPARPFAVRRALLCVLPLLLFSATAIKTVLAPTLGFVLILPYELTAYLGMSLFAARGWSSFEALYVVLGYIGIAFLPAFVSFLGGYLYPKKRGWGLILLLTPVGIDFCLSMLLSSVMVGGSGWILILANALYATALILISGIFHLPEKRNEQKDLSFYDRY